MYVVWFDGFASGIAYRTTGNQLLELISEATVLAYLDKYCRDNPLRNVALAADCLLRDKGVATGGAFSCH